MDIFRINGGNRLSGEIRVKAAKNAVLPILAACMLADGSVTVTDAPGLMDIENMRRILEALGCRTCFSDGEIRVNSKNADGFSIPAGLSGKLRSSVFMVGPLLARFQKACCAHPGGCDIGLRPIDLHIKGLKALGVNITQRGGMIRFDGSAMKPAEVLLDFPSVGATENLMMASCMLSGRSVILNAACEPEVTDLAAAMNKMGARITGAGTGRIVIDGVSGLGGCTHRPIPDRIAAGTYLCCAAAAGGTITVKNTVSCDMAPITGKLREMGCGISEGDGLITLEAPKRLTSVQIQTQPHPGFPTDMQSQMTALLSVSDGTGVIRENVFENRFAHISELKKMGADILVCGNSAVITGGNLRGARMKALNLRAGAALAIAALAAEGESEIEDVFYIDRGYDGFEKELTALGASIRRTEDEGEKEHGAGESEKG